jgi:hypothetical protein
VASGGLRAAALMWWLARVLHDATQSPYSRRQIVQWTRHTLATLLQHMGIDHGGGHVRMAQQLLNGADVRTPLEKVRGETVARPVEG